MDQQAFDAAIKEFYTAHCWREADRLINNSPVALDNSALSRPQLSTPADPADRRRRREGRGEASGGNDDLGPVGLS